MLAQLRLGGNGVDQLVTGILGVAGHKADVIIAGHRAQQVEQIRKVHLFFQTLAVAVDVLSQQCDLLIACLHKTAELGKDITGLAALLAAAHIRHDAVGTEVVAAVHDGQPCAELALTPDGDILHDDRALGGLHQHTLMLLQLLGNELRQGIDSVHAKHKVNVRIALAQLFYHVLLVGHASAQADDEIMLFFLESLQGTYIAEHTLLGMLTHGAGVEEDQVCILGLIAQAIADVHQHTLDPLAVVHVLLTAIAVHKGQRRRIIELLYQLSGNVIMFKTNVFQSNHPSPPGRSALCGENLLALSEKSLLYSIPCLYAPGKRFRANFMVQWAFSCACFSQQASHTPISTTAQSCT